MQRISVELPIDVPSKGSVCFALWEPWILSLTKKGEKTRQKLEKADKIITTARRIVAAADSHEAADPFAHLLPSDVEEVNKWSREFSLDLPWADGTDQTSSSSDTYLKKEEVPQSLNDIVSSEASTAVHSPARPTSLSEGFDPLFSDHGRLMSNGPSPAHQRGRGLIQPPGPESTLSSQCPSCGYVHTFSIIAQAQEPRSGPGVAHINVSSFGNVFSDQSLNDMTLLDTPIDLWVGQSEGEIG